MAPVGEGTRRKSRGLVVPEKRSAGGSTGQDTAWRPGIAPCGLVPIRARGYGTMVGRCLCAPALEGGG
jgi:hypothetical protein